MFLEKASGATRDIHVLADQVAVHPRDEVVRIEVDVLDLVVELRGDVIAQPLRIHADFEISLRADSGPARLGHFLAGHGNEAVHVDVRRQLALRELEHRRPEQRVVIDDVLTDEVILLDFG